jgi:hypothetical protein
MKIEKIKFERTGGFAGIRLAAEIEMDELPEEQRREILGMLDEMDFEEFSDKPASEVSFPDGFVYAISVESEKREYCIVTDESALPADMQPLVEILESITKRRMRKNKHSG